MKISDFQKTIKIYSSKKLEDGWVSINYAYILGPNAVSTEHTVEIEDRGTALESLYYHLCN